MKRGLYAVGHTWGDGSIGFYMFHGNEVMECTKKEALSSLNYVKTKYPNKDYKLYKLKLKEVA